MVICLERGADLHMAQLITPPPTVSCFSKIQIGFTLLVPAYPGSPGQRAVKRLYIHRSVSGSHYTALSYDVVHDVFVLFTSVQVIWFDSLVSDKTSALLHVLHNNYVSDQTSALRR